MATSKIAVTEGSGANIATNSITEDAVTKQVQRTSLNNSSGTEVGTSANPIVIVGSVQGTFTSGPASVSGTVGASVIGTVPVVQSGTVISSISGTVFASVSGIVGASIIGAVNINPASVSGTVGASVIGAVPVTQSGAWTASVVGALSTVGSVLSIPGIVSTLNSSTATLGGGAVLNGTSEDVKDFGSITISVFTDQASATDGLSIQQSSNGTNWDITDVYTIAASTGKTFSVQPAARFFRIVYTNGATPQGSFRLQTVFHPIATKSSSQRSSDAYTNETDLEQVWAFGSFWNGTTWDRVKGTATAGMLVNPGSSSVLSLQTGTRITSVIGAYAEDVGHTTGDVGLFTLGIRNDNTASTMSANLDYGGISLDSIGRVMGKPFAAEESAVRGQGSVNGVASVQLIAAPGAGLRNYITDVTFVNTGAAASKVDITDGDGSVLGTTIAPAGGGSNLIGLQTPMKPSVNQPVNLSARTASSVITAFAYGYKSP